MEETTAGAICDLGEAEIQALIAMLELAEPKETPNNCFYHFYPKTMEEAASYFRKFRIDWTRAFASLVARGFAEGGAASYLLTERGLARARRVRDLRPPIYYWYEEFYSEAPNSAAFSRFCEELYGLALCQDGFSDMSQIGALIESAGIGKGCRVLDLGCGPGMIDEYVSDCVGALVTGMDYSPGAISLARARTRSKRDRLSFEIGNLDDLPFDPRSFDAVISIDSLYMPSDLGSTLAQARRIIRPGGRMAFFYTHMLGSARDQRESLRGEGTPLGEALSRSDLAYRVIDFSEGNHRFLCRKREIVARLKDEFSAEGRAFLYDYLFEQSLDGAAAYDPETATMSRYLYVVEP